MKNFVHSAVLIIFLLGIIAPACGFAWGGQYSVIEICTAQGFETKIVENGQKPDGAPHHKMAGECQFCFSNAHVTSFIPEISVVTSLAYDSLDKKIYLNTLKRAQRLSFDHSARAPPSALT